MFNWQQKPKKYNTRVQGLSVSYGPKRVLQDISFRIHKKDVFGIIGLSGSGKSTLLKALMGFVHYKGFIDRERGKLGYCPQDEAFFNELTIKENILLFANMNSTPSHVALNRAAKMMKELKINESADKIAGELSGGQAKRLNIILSILHDPETIILDEPFAGLDYVTRLLLWDFIKSLKHQGKTLILTTHLLEEAQKHCNNLLIISHGERFALGSINDLKRSLKFREFIHFKFNYLNKLKQDRVKRYCSKRGYWVLELDDNEASFGLPDNDDRDNIIGHIKRLGVDYKVTEYRPPGLNELFMLSARGLK